MGDEEEREGRRRCRPPAAAVTGRPVVHDLPRLRRPVLAHALASRGAHGSGPGGDGGGGGGGRDDGQRLVL